MPRPAKPKTTFTPDFAFEEEAGAPQVIVCGVDEAGRGPLAGPVVAAAVILDPAHLPPGLDDSKKLTAKKREALYGLIRAQAQVGVGMASVEEIDRINILAASMLAMSRAVAALPSAPAHALIDGNRSPELACPATPVVKGDSRSLSIAAASIVAKVTRDRMMIEMAAEFPAYGFERHMGYGTKQHLDALENAGPCPHHRKSFAPVAALLTQDIESAESRETRFSVSESVNPLIPQK